MQLLPEEAAHALEGSPVPGAGESASTPVTPVKNRSAGMAARSAVSAKASPIRAGGKPPLSPMRPAQLVRFVTAAGCRQFKGLVMLYCL